MKKCKKQPKENKETNAVKYTIMQRVNMQLTPNQQLYVNAMNNKHLAVVIATGPSGTGKTLLATHVALNKVISRDYERLVITRPAVTVGGEAHGFLPGSLTQKMDPYMQPVIDYINASKQSCKKTVEICPLSHMRGRTFDDTVVIADEMQNSTTSQFKMLLTRLGNNSKLIITGDMHQSDREENGLLDFIQRYNKWMDSISDEQKRKTCFRHTPLYFEDVKRSATVREALEIYETTSLN